MMPDTAKILPFRSRELAAELTPQQAETLVEEYFSISIETRSEDWKLRVLSNADAVLAICAFLREIRDSEPRRVLAESCLGYEWIRSASDRLSFFDERDYFMGELALLAGTASRLLGQRADAIRWLDRAEAAFRHTVNPGPGLSNVAYVRLSLKFELGEYDDVLDLLPSLHASFERLGMITEKTKCRLLEAMTFKGTGRIRQALEVLEPARCEIRGRVDPRLEARVIAEVADLYQNDDRSADAVPLYQEALGLLQPLGSSGPLADLKMFVGSAHLERGEWQHALEAYRSAASDYHHLGMETRVAYMHVLTAGVLLNLGRNREAEWEILVALPTIEEQKMVPEGFAAVALLRESVRLRKMDPNALSQLRQQLQSKTQPS